MVTTSSIFHNLCWTFFENLLGSIFYALLFAISVSKFGSSMDSPLIEKIISVASNKTLGYKSLGMSGLITMFVNALLCNWMVTMGAVDRKSTRLNSSHVAISYAVFCLKKKTSDL